MMHFNSKSRSIATRFCYKGFIAIATWNPSNPWQFLISTHLPVTVHFQVAFCVRRITLWRPLKKRHYEDWNYFCCSCWLGAARYNLWHFIFPVMSMHHHFSEENHTPESKTKLKAINNGWDAMIFHFSSQLLCLAIFNPPVEYWTTFWDAEKTSIRKWKPERNMKNPSPSGKAVPNRERAYICWHHRCISVFYVISHRYSSIFGGKRFAFPLISPPRY